MGYFSLELGCVQVPPKTRGSGCKKKISQISIGTKNQASSEVDCATFWLWYHRPGRVTAVQNFDPLELPPRSSFMGTRIIRPPPGVRAMPFRTLSFTSCSPRRLRCLSSLTCQRAPGPARRSPTGEPPRSSTSVPCSLSRRARASESPRPPCPTARTSTTGGSGVPAPVANRWGALRGPLF